MRDESELYQELGARQRAYEEALSERQVFCVECRALMIHAGAGCFYCPYQRAGAHEHARRALRAEIQHRR